MDEHGGDGGGGASGGGDASPAVAPSVPSRRAVLLDRIKGLIFGQAMGDAVGLSTEFMTKVEAGHVYGDSFRRRTYRYKEMYQDGHRSRWRRGDWTDDTDQMLLILRSLLLSDLVPDGDIFGELLRKWVYGGFEWPVRKRAMGIGQTVMSVILAAESGKGYREAADSVWHASRRSLAANGAVMRTSVVAVPFFRDVEVAVDAATTFAGATHSDPRSVVSCIAVVVALANMLQCAADGTEPNFETIHGLALQRCNRYMEQFALSTTAPASASVMTSFSYAAAMEELQQVFAETTLEALRLDAHGSIGYTFKCLGSGLVCWRKVAVDGCSFVDAVCDLSAEAGDADTNAAVAGALMGCWLGYEKLMEQVAPLGWQDMHLRDELLVPLMDMLVGKLDEHKIL